MQQRTNTESDYGQMDPNAVYGGEGGDGKMTNAEAASYGLATPKSESRKYGLGAEPTTWQDTEHTPAQKRAAGMQAKADSYRGMGADDKADALENSLYTKEQRADQKKLFGLQLKGAQRADKAGDFAEKDADAERAAEAASGEWLKARSMDKDGNPRMLTTDDYTGALQHKAEQLFKNGHTKAANIVMDEFSKRTMTQIALQTAQREKALGEGMQAFAASKDPNALKDFYNQFVPDGAKVTNIKMDPKGNILVEREDMDGRKLQTNPIPVDKFIATANSFKNPMALYEFSQNEFKNNLDLRRTKATEVQAGAAATNAANQGKLIDSTIQERDLTRKQNEESLKAITDLLPKYNAIKDKRSPEALAILSDAVLNSAQKSGDAAKLLSALKDVSSRGGRKAIGKIEKTDDGVLVFDTDNKLTTFLTASGLSLPPGMKEPVYEQERKKAANAGVEARLGYDDDTGERVLGYIGKDGNGYPTLEAAAAAAKPAGKTDSQLPPKKAGGLDNSTRAAPNGRVNIVAQESEEMGLGKRTAYSPEAQAIIDGKAASDKAESDAYKARELKRAQGLSRTYTAQ